MDERVGERERAAEERRSRRERLLERVERITEAPLLILAAVMIPLIVGPFVWELSERQEEVFVALDIFIWAAFVADIVVKTAIAPRKLAYLKAHWIDLAILVAPPIRPLRLVRLFSLRLAYLHGAAAHGAGRLSSGVRGAVGDGVRHGGDDGGDG